MSWRDNLRPASFRGAPFFVETGGQTGGRRGQTFEFPKRDQPVDEDLGRRATRRIVAAYVIGDDYTLDADLLEVALNAEGAGLLIHPTMGELRARCESYTRTERSQQGRLAIFDMAFVEAGVSMPTLIGADTQQQAKAQAQTSGDIFAEAGGKDSDWL